MSSKANRATKPAGEVVCAISRLDGAEAAVQLAAGLGRRMGLGLALVEVQVPVPPLAGVPLAGPQPVVPPPGVPDPPPATEDAGASPAIDLAAVADRAEVRPTRLDAMVAPPADALRELSREPATKLLVVADHGGGPLGSMLGGSGGRGAMRDAGCPLVLVPAKARVRLGDPLTLLCGVVDNDVAPTVIACAGWLMGALSARVVVLEVVDQGEQDDEDARRRLEDMAEGLLPGGSVDLTTVRGDPVHALAETARAQDAALVVLGRPDHGALGSAVFGSVVHDLLETRSVPVVVVPDAFRARPGV